MCALRVSDLIHALTSKRFSDYNLAKYVTAPELQRLAEFIKKIMYAIRISRTYKTHNLESENLMRLLCE